MKRLPVIVGFLFILFVFGFIGAPRALSETLVVAHLAPMSGTAAGWGIATDRAIRMAVDDFNARGGLKIGKETYKIQLVTMDHRYVPGEALGAAKKVAGEGIKYAFGVGAGIMPAMQPVLTENKVINMVSMGAGVEFTNAKNPYTFRTMPSSELGYAVYYPKLVKMFGPLKIGVVHNNDELGRADTRCRERVIKEKNLPIEEVVEFVERDAIDFSPVVTRLIAKKVNLILNELAPAQGATFFKQTWELGYKGRVGILRAGHSLSKLIQAAGKEALEGLIDALNWPPGQYPSAEYGTFNSKYMSLFKEEPLTDSYRGYAATQFLAAALEKAGTLDTERVVKVMYDIEVQTLLGPTFMVGKSLGYGIKTQMSHSMPLCEVRNGQLKLIEALSYKE